jgi:hypothetical protein
MTPGAPTCSVRNPCNHCFIVVIVKMKYNNFLSKYLTYYKFSCPSGSTAWMEGGPLISLVIFAYWPIGNVDVTGVC